MNSEENDRDLTGAQTDAPEAASAEATEEQRPAGFCRLCGKPLSAGEVRNIDGTIYCAEHMPGNTAPPPPPPASEWDVGAAPRTIDTSVSPGLAFVLGLIPGVGAIYNAQYAKGLVHVVIFGLLISIVGSGAGGLEPLFGLLIPAWVFYMAFEACHTAKRRQAGEAVDEFSSLIPLKGRSSSQAGPIVLIALGGLFLLLTLDVIELYQVGRFWPVLLIAAGVWMLMNRRREGDNG
jgi:hypothetical protein